MMILIIDSNFVCYMFRFAFGGLNFEEKPTAIIFGFLNQLYALAGRFKTNKFVFCWDSRKSYRRQRNPNYKSSRREEKTDEDREDDRIAFKQFSDLRQCVLPKLGFKNNYIQTGCEADDLIASIVMNNPGDFVIVSSDNDLLQLLDTGLNYCALYNPITKKQITATDFRKEWGIDPFQWTAVKSIAGCNGDNVPGVPGVGEKTAVKFITGKLSKGVIYDRIMDAEGAGGLIEETRWFVELPLPGTKKFELQENENFLFNKFVDICEEYGFRSFLAKDRLNGWKERFDLK